MNVPTTQRFRIAIHRGREGYFACVIDIPGCVSRGDSEVEAVENARSAIRAYVLVARIFSAEKPLVQLEISA